MPDNPIGVVDLPTSRPIPNELRPGHSVVLDADPPKASLVNLATNEEHEFQFNPQIMQETIEAKYNRTLINGLSHERLSYKNTSNNVIPIELYMSQLLQDKQTNIANSSPTILQRKAWLQSLIYPVSNEDFGYTGPPQVLFIWPKVARLIGKVMRVSFLHREFSNRNLSTIRLVAKLRFEHDISRRLLMEDVQINGSLSVEER